MVKYCKKIGDFVTLSMHGYENEEHLLQLSDYDPTSCAALSDTSRRIAVDDEGRCALVRIDEGNWSLHRFSNESTEPIGSLVVSSKAIDERIRYVLDFCFLEGFFEPTLALLYEAVPNWPSQLAVKKNTVRLVILTVSMATGGFTPIFHSNVENGLPSECRRMIPMRKSIGGVILMGPNVFCHADHIGSCTYLALNNFGYLGSTGVKTSTHQLFSRQNLEMVSDDLGIWSTHQGQIYSLKLNKGNRGVASMVIESVGSNPSVSSFKCLDDGRLLVAASIGSHRVYELGGSGQDMLVDEDNLYGDEEMDAFYTSTTVSNTSNKTLTSISLNNVVFEVPSIGCVSDFTYGSNSEFFCVGGSVSVGHLTRIAQKLPCKTKTSFKLEHAKRCFVIETDSVVEYLIVSTDTSSMVLSTSSESMSEVEQTLFCLESPTIYACSTPAGVLQVCPNAVRLLSPTLNELVAEHVFEQQIESAYYLAGLLRLHLYGGTMKLITLDMTLVLEEHSVSSSSMVIFEGQHALAIHYEDGTVKVLAVKDGMHQVVFTSAVVGFRPQVLLNGSNSVAEKPDRLLQINLFESAGQLFLIAVFDRVTCVYRWTDGSFVKVTTRHIEHVGVSLFSNGLIFVGQSRSVTLLFFGALGYPRWHQLDLRASALVQYSATQLVAVAEGNVRLVEIDPEWCLDYGLPFIQRLFDANLRRITYNRQNECFGVVSATLQKFTLPDDEYTAIADNKEWKPTEPVDASLLPSPQSFKMKFNLLAGFTVIDSFELEEYEQVVSCEASSLQTKETSEGRKNFFVLGASVVKGEDRPVRGRVLIFDVMQVVSDASSELQKKLKLLSDTQLKTPVSTVCPIAGHLAITSGVKTILHEFEDNETLTGVAFVDAGVYISASVALKRFLILGDLGGRGLGLYGFQEKPSKLVELGRISDPDECRVPVLHVAYLAEGQRLLICPVSDEGVVSFYTYAPASRRSIGGTRLSVKGTYRTHGRLVRVHQAVLDGGVGFTYVSADGSIGLLRPLADEGYRVLSGVVSRVMTEVVQPAGLHPKGCRGGCRQVIDADLVERLISLPVLTQRRLLGDASMDTIFKHV